MTPSQPSITLYCVDFANSVSVGNKWWVNVTNLGDPSVDLGNTRRGRANASDPDNYLKYQQAAYLASLFDSYSVFTGVEYLAPGSGTPTPFGDKQGVWSGIHAAIWSIMTNGFPNAFSGVNNKALAQAMAAPFLAAAEDAAATGFAGMDFSEWSVLSDQAMSTNGTGGKQEYLVRTTVTPEPATWALLATGLLLLFGLGRSRFRNLARA